MSISVYICFNFDIGLLGQPVLNISRVFLIPFCFMSGKYHYSRHDKSVIIRHLSDRQFLLSFVK